LGRGLEGAAEGASSGAGFAEASSGTDFSGESPGADFARELAGGLGEVDFDESGASGSGDVSEDGAEGSWILGSEPGTIAVWLKRSERSVKRLY
jgi:hypothetical protein